MSYGGCVSFKKINADDIYDFFVDFKAYILKHFEDIADDEKHYAPFNRKHIVPYENFKDIPNNEYEESKAWVQQIFKYHYFYLKDRNILGVYGVPRCTRNLFDLTVYFQDSTDQNYGRDAWEGISDFEEIYDKWMSMNDNELVKYYNDKHDYFKEYRQLSEEDIVYYKQSYAYEEIWNLLPDIWEEDKKIYLSIFGGLWDNSNVLGFMSMCYKKYLAWHNELWNTNREPPDEVKEIIAETKKGDSNG